MPQQLLNGTDIVAILEKARGEAVAERVRRYWFADAG